MKEPILKVIQLLRSSPFGIEGSYLLCFRFQLFKPSLPIPTAEFRIIGLRPDKIEEYRRLHAAVWPEILSNIKECRMGNYSIFLHQLQDGNHYLFSYLEYAGVDIKADSARMVANPKVQEWCDLCKPCQEPLSNRAEDDWWSNLEEVFHAN